MSINLFYPDNRKIAERVAGLISSITSLQSSLADLDDDMNQIQTETLEKLHQYAAQENIITIADAKKAIAKIVPDEFMEKVNEFLTERESTNERATNAIEGILIGSLVIGRLKLGITVTEALQIFSVMDIASDVIRSVRMLASADTYAQGLMNLRGLPKDLKWAANTWELGQEGSTFSRVLKWAKKLSAAIEILGVALDLVLIINAAIEGKKQRNQLLDTLNNLFPRRILIKMILEEAHIPLLWVSNVSAITTIIKYAPGQNEAIAALETTVLAGMKAQKDNITFAYVYQQLKKQDDEGGAYQDYDPTMEKAKEYADKLENENESHARVMPEGLIVGLPPKGSTFFPRTHAVMGNRGTSLINTGHRKQVIFSIAEFGQLNPFTQRRELSMRTLDLFWPDNPKRKARAQELYDDCKWIRQQLEDIKTYMSTLGTNVKSNLDTCMKVIGLESFSSLEAKILENCSVEDIEKWKEEKDRMDKFDKVQGIVFGVVNICAAVVGVVGVVTIFIDPPLGGAIIAVAGAIDIAAIVIQGLIEIIEGAKIRDQCREAIHNLLPARLDARIAYEKMQIMVEWMETINTIMGAFEKTMSQDAAAGLVAQIHVLSSQMVVKY